jgi:arabinose-5-phosphate isomerase
LIRSAGSHPQSTGARRLRVEESPRDIEVSRRARDVILKEAEAIRELAARIDSDFVRAIDLILKSDGKVVVSGIGKSGIIGKKIAATLTSTGTPAFFLHSAEGVHGDLGVVARDDVVLVVSNSGETEELLRLLPVFKRLGVPVIALCGNRSSSLARHADVCIDTGVAEEACPHGLVPTASTAAALAMGDALAISLLHERGFEPEDFAQLHPGGSLGRAPLLRVRDLMLVGDAVPITPAGASLGETISEMTAKRGITSVVDRRGALVGVITDGDLRRLLERKKDIFSLRARDVMTKQPKTIAPDELAARAARLMENHGITALIVTDGKRAPCGIIHLHDIMKARVV